MHLTHKGPLMLCNVSPTCNWLESSPFSQKPVVYDRVPL